MQRLHQVEQLISNYVKKQEALRGLNAFINAPRPSLKGSFKANNSSDGLRGSLIAIKDNICTSDLPTTCGSRALANHISPYDATVVTRIREAGGIVAGKTNLDEFGMGSHSVHSSFEAVKPLSGHSAGGSSGGSAVAVATGQCDGALGTDTGGSVRLPAAYNGIYGFKPSYGLVSRWGVVAYANSLDTVGFLARDVDTVRRLFRQCNAYDPKDPTNLTPATRARLLSSQNARSESLNKLRIGVPEEYNITTMCPSVRSAWSRTLRGLHTAGHTIHAISLPSTAQALSAYYVLAPAEASSNLAKYDSVRYGTRPPALPSTDSEQSKTEDALFSRARHYGLGAEVHRRILLGAYSLSAAAIDNYFMQAQRVRRCVQREFDDVFASPNPLRESQRPGIGHVSVAGVDVIVCPTAPTLPPMLHEVEAQDPLDAYAGDVFTVPASLAGLPAISVPVRRQEHSADSSSIRSVGMQLVSQFGNDELLLDMAKEMETTQLCHADSLEADSLP